MEIEELNIRNCVFGFKCNADWENMQVVLAQISDPQDTSEVRFCSTCQREVHLSLDDQQLVTNIKLNRCIALSRDVNNYGDLELGLVEFVMPR